MKNINKRTEFEKQWEEVFNNVEMTPPASAWDKIDSALSKDEAGYFRRKAFVYKLLAAASIAFALGVGIFSINHYLNSSIENAGQVTEVKIERDEHKLLQDSKPNTVLDSNSEKPTSVKDKNQIINKSETKSETVILAQSSNKELANDKTDNIETLAGINQGSYALENVNNSENNRAFYSLSEIGRQGLNPANEVIDKIDHIYLIPIMPKGASKRKKEKELGLFLAGLDFSTGTFDPNFQNAGNSYSSSGFAFSSRAEYVDNNFASLNTSNKDFLLVRGAGEESQPEISYSYGANVGFKLSKRIIVQTGIAYRKSNTTISTTGYLQETGSNNKIPIVASYQYQIEGLSSVNSIAETDLNNQYEFASIPLRAGYILLDKKLNVALMAGISSEFFLGNKIVDESNFLSSLSNSTGEGSPFKSVYFNGSLGTMLGYTIAESYVITFEPSYRFAVNSFTREDFYLNSYPSSFMLSFGVAYNFR